MSPRFGRGLSRHNFLYSVHVHLSSHGMESENLSSFQVTLCSLLSPLSVRPSKKERRGGNKKGRERKVGALYEAKGNALSALMGVQLHYSTNIEYIAVCFLTQL